MGRRMVQDVTVLSGAAMSSVINVNEGEVVGVIMPATVDAATDVQFQALTTAVSSGNAQVGLTETFGDVYDDAGTLVKIAAPTAARFYSFRRATGLRGLGRMRIKLSGNAGADRVFRIVTVAD